MPILTGQHVFEIHSIINKIKYSLQSWAWIPRSPSSLSAANGHNPGCQVRIKKALQSGLSELGTSEFTSTKCDRILGA